MYRPAGLPVPLVVMLHGGFGSASRAQSSYGWNAVVYPDGVRAARNAGIDDVAFISQVVRAVSAMLAVDQNRVYLQRRPHGVQACDTTLFAAIGPDSATQLGACPAPHPISLIHIHGTADTRIPYAGGQGDGYAKIDGPAVPYLVARWRGVDGCRPRWTG